jgi:pimeloyl-ACP methyl ester carboxylesterase
MACRLHGRAVLAVAAVLAGALSAGAQVCVEDHGFAPVGDTRLYYEVAGRGEPVVLLHGGLLDSRMWDAQWAPFAARFRVVRFDARGFGGSALTAAAFSNYEDLAALLDYLGVERAHLVGLSLGGQTAINFALTYPQRVSSLVLVGPGLSGFELAGDDSGQRWWERVNAALAGDLAKATELWLADPFMAPAMEQPELARRLRRIAVENPQVWLANPILDRTPVPPAVGRVAEIKAPTLLVLGGRDLPVIKAIVELLQAKVAGAKRLDIPGAGHMVPMEKPAEFNAPVIEFLTGVAGAAAPAR